MKNDSRWLCTIVLLFVSCALSAEALANCTVRYVPLNKNFRVQQHVAYVQIIGTDGATGAEPGATKMTDMAAQLQAAQWLYSSIFDIDTPMSTQRYSHVARVEALLVPMALAGLAYDETIRVTPNTQPAVCALRIKIADNLRPHNVTPAHELFHLFQYGLTMFKRSWLIEGTARWAESAFLPGVPSEKPLPQNANELLAFMQSSYSAGPIWNRLARLIDPIGQLEPPSNISALKYSDGTPVLVARRLYGRAFIGDLFLALGQADREIAAKAGIPSDRWTESEQRSPRHDVVIWQTIQRVAAKHAAGITSPPELVRFLSIELTQP